ncbi:hypothetical protein BRC82_01755 [Halobacteriales archaeon QS_1_67_19]|nr:MAG: hypothetical protein BRC82_01755 [Halobacteriales archaeon QS_1_67_19]
MGEPPTPLDDPDAGERRKAFDALAEASADGIVMLDEDSVVRYANPAVERILGYEPEELVGESQVKIIPDRLRERHLAAFRRYLNTGERHLDWEYVELPGQHKAGHEVPLAISFNDFTHDGDRYFVGTFRDITERKEAEQELRHNRQQLRRLLEILPVGVIVADADGSLIEVNEAARRVWGGFADADSVAEYEQYTGWWVETGEPVDSEEWPLARALRGEEVTDTDPIEIERFDGGHRTVLFQAMPIRNEAGDVERAVVTMVDVTEREARKRQLQRQNERLDRFASMLAHELRNPLEIARTYLDFLEHADPDTVDQIDDALGRIEELIEVLLVLARGRDEIGDREPVDLADAAREAWTNAETADAELEIESSRAVDANPTHLQQLLENLFRNAVEHSDGAVAVRVGALADGFYVEDTGPGIPPEERDAVMDAGFTTSADGTGLGLTFVGELANVYGRECLVTESADGGARFEFRSVDSEGERD